jgi:hypothetical protein
VYIGASAIDFKPGWRKGILFTQAMQLQVSVGSAYAKPRGLNAMALCSRFTFQQNVQRLDLKNFGASLT